MDIVSYLLGKEHGGVTPTGEISITENGVHNVSGYATANVDVEPNLETKSVTITENTTTTITPTSGKDGMSSVEVITNVPTGGGSVELPTNINLRFTNSTGNDFSFLENIDTSNLTTANYMFDGCTGMTEMPTINTSNVTQMMGVFRSCSNLTTTKLYNTSKVTSFWRMFYNCSKITTLPQFDTSLTTNVQEMCSGCSLLANVSTYNLEKIDAMYSMQNWFQNCPSLTNESLNNIMASCLTVGDQGTQYKTLKFIGLSSAQATTCTGLSNWAALSAAGWTTGY